MTDHMNDTTRDALALARQIAETVYNAERDGTGPAGEIVEAQWAAASPKTRMALILIAARQAHELEDANRRLDSAWIQIETFARMAKARARDTGRVC